ncbi:MAG: DUF2975 domain-containing protein, partial [Micrococcales bacterium]|nr:DUF2975 domain-containing protein [Micrococcales bacterium]
MKRATTFLRVLLALVPLAVAVAALVLYSISSDMARDYPELAHLQVPVFVGVVIGMAPVVAAVIGVFVFLRAVDRGDAFSATAVRVLGRLKWCVGIFAGYFVAGLVGFWVVTG